MKVQEVQQLIDILPIELSKLIDSAHYDELTEIVLDLGRIFEYRISDFNSVYVNKVITRSHLDQIINNLPKIGPDGRVGLAGTLHRISVVWGKDGTIVGFTMRIGRFFQSSSSLIEDLVLSGESVLIVGKPGAGKSSMLRKLANQLGSLRRVIVVDKTGEIAGESEIPHTCIGLARRFKVPYFKDQSETMLQALESHTMETCLIDEISTKSEADAARTIAQRGIQLIATAHGRTIEDVIKNPPLSDILGGIKTVTIGDKKATIDGTGKVIQEREMDPTFTVLVELVSFDELNVYTDVARAVDVMLKGGYLRPEKRRIINDKIVVIETEKADMPQTVTIKQQLDYKPTNDRPERTFKSRQEPKYEKSRPKFRRR